MNYIIAGACIPHTRNPQTPGPSEDSDTGLLIETPADVVPSRSQVKALEVAEAARRKEAARAAERAKGKAALEQQRAERLKRTADAKVPNPSSSALYDHILSPSEGCCRHLPVLSGVHSDFLLSMSKAALHFSLLTSPRLAANLVRVRALLRTRSVQMGRIHAAQVPELPLRYWSEMTLLTREDPMKPVLQQSRANEFQLR